MKFKVIVAETIKTTHIIDADSFAEAEQAALIENKNKEGISIGDEIIARAKSISER